MGIDETYVPTTEDHLLLIGLRTTAVLGAIQQAYVDGKIKDLETYNRLYEVAWQSDLEIRKLLATIEANKKLKGYSDGSHTN